MLIAVIVSDTTAILQVKADARASQQFLLLSHLYSQKADAAALTKLRKELLRPKYTTLELALGSVVGATTVGGSSMPCLMSGFTAEFVLFSTT